MSQIQQPLKPPGDPAIQRAAEAEVIGDLLVDRSLHDMSRMLQSEDFSIPAYRQAWRAILEDPLIDTEFALQMALPSITQEELLALRRATRKPANYQKAVRYILRTSERLRIETLLGECRLHHRLADLVACEDGDERTAVKAAM